MRKTPKYLSLLVLLLASVFSFAQSPVLSVVQGGVVADRDSMFLQTYDTIVNYTVTIVNNGPGSYTGPIYLQALYDSTAVLDTSWADTIVTDMGMGDTITFSHQDVVLPTSTRYKGGGNIVIVWPYAAPTGATGDSGSVYVWVDGIVGIDVGKEMENRVRVYPNPASSRVRMDVKNHIQDFEYVRIVNLTGIEQFRSEHVVSDIDISRFQRGIYLMEIKFKDGIKGTYKLLLTR